MTSGPELRAPFVTALVHRKAVTGCQAAIVTAVRPDSTVDVNTFGPGGAVPAIRLVEGTENGMWHWPGKECP